MNCDTPILLLSGEKDPVGNNGKGIRTLMHCFQRAGVKDVQMKLYPGLRHNLFIEDEKQEVFQDIFRWMKKAL